MESYADYSHPTVHYDHHHASSMHLSMPSTSTSQIDPRLYTMTPNSFAAPSHNGVSLDMLSNQISTATAQEQNNENQRPKKRGRTQVSSDAEEEEYQDDNDDAEDGDYVPTAKNGNTDGNVQTGPVLDEDEEDEDEDVDPEEAGPMEEGETVLRLGSSIRGNGNKGKSGVRKPSNKKASQKLLGDAIADDEGKTSGRRKIQIEYIQDKSRRHITFSKRKAGIMKKAYELSTLTGTQVLLLVVSETGTVFTYTTSKLQPLVTEQAGKNLIRECLDSQDDAGIADFSRPSTGEPKHGGTVSLKARPNRKSSVSPKHAIAPVSNGGAALISPPPLMPVSTAGLDGLGATSIVGSIPMTSSMEPHYSNHPVPYVGSTASSETMQLPVTLPAAPSDYSNAMYYASVPQQNNWPIYPASTESYIH